MANALHRTVHELINHDLEEFPQLYLLIVWYFKMLVQNIMAINGIISDQLEIWLNRWCARHRPWKFDKFLSSISVRAARAVNAAFFETAPRRVACEREKWIAWQDWNVFKKIVLPVSACAARFVSFIFFYQKARQTRMSCSCYRSNLIANSLRQ